MRVLSIDFDIIMAPCIQLYNSMADDDNRGIRDAEEYFPQLKFILMPDFNTYIKLTTFLIRQLKNCPKEKVFFIEDHNKLAKLLEGEKDVDLCNIDHHHDICYGDFKISSRILIPNVGNWVKYLKDKGIVTHYTWVYNNTSNFPDDDIEDYYLDEWYEFQQIDLSQIIGQIDKLVICHSPQWVPSNYDALWDIWIKIAEEWYGTEFDVI